MAELTGTSVPTIAPVGLEGGSVAITPEQPGGQESTVEVIPEAQAEEMAKANQAAGEVIEDMAVDSLDKSGGSDKILAELAGQTPDDQTSQDLNRAETGVDKAIPVSTPDTAEGEAGRPETEQPVDSGESPNTERTDSDTQTADVPNTAQENVRRLTPEEEEHLVRVKKENGKLAKILGKRGEFKNIKNQIRAELKAVDQNISEEELNNLAIDKYYEGLAQKHIEKGTIEEIKKDPAFAEILTRIVSSLKPGEPVDGNKTTKDALIQYLRKKDLKKKGFLKKILSLLAITVAGAFVSFGEEVAPKELSGKR